MDDAIHVLSGSHPLRVSTVLLSVALEALCASCTRAGSAPRVMTSSGASGPSHGLVKFDIPPAPLENSLFDYSEKTGVEVFADDSLIAGRWSASLRGSYDVETALRKLLLGSGLDIRQAGPRAFTVVSIGAPDLPAGWRPSWASDVRCIKFYAALQINVFHTLCMRPETAPGSYRAALAIWINSGGTIERVRLLSSRIDGEIGQAVLARIKGIFVGKPPVALVQPVIFVILPRAAEKGSNCGLQRGGI